MRERWCASDRGLVPWTVKVRSVGSREVKFKACNWCDRPTQASKPKAPKPIRKRVALGAKRARAKAAGDVLPEQKAMILAFYRYRCGYCEQRQAKQWDHWIPIAKDGLETASNLVPSCVQCNSKKGTSTKWEPKRRHPFMAPVDVSGEPIPERIHESEIPH